MSLAGERPPAKPRPPPEASAVFTASRPREFAPAYTLHARSQKAHDKQPPGTPHLTGPQCAWGPGASSACHRIIDAAPQKPLSGRTHPMAKQTIEYIFTLPGGSREVFLFELDEVTFELAAPQLQRLPAWTELNDHRCPNCPLDPATHLRCPLAASLVPVVHRLDGLLSWDLVRVEVVTAERTISQQTSAQRAIGSMLGLINSVSGCPHLAYFRPMARFHLPLANREETIYRATSMYLLAQYLRAQNGESPDFAMQGLQEIYSNVQVVNAAMVRRLRHATETDYIVNAMVFLDLYALAVQHTITDSLDGIRHWFAPYLTPLAPPTDPTQG